MSKKFARKIFNVSVVGDVNSVTAIDYERETPPAESGVSAEAVEDTWRAVVDLHRTGVYPATTFCLRHRGKILINRSLGHIRGNGPNDPVSKPGVLASPESPICLFSASKAMTALLMHMLADESDLRLLDPVSYYLPEFAKHGKAHITVHQLLAHRGGVPRLPIGTPVEVLWDRDEVWDRLCQAKPWSRSGNNVHYHALTGGFIFDRIVEKITGAPIDAYLDRKIRKPMAMKYFTFGLAEQHRNALAENYATGLPNVFPVNYIFKNALGADMADVQKVINHPKWYDAVVPAGNLVGTAEEVSRFYQMMLNGGTWNEQQICKRITIERAIQPFGRMQMDWVLMAPMRYSAGFMLGANPVGLWGYKSKAAFGHIGLLNKFCWADNARDISVALLNSGIPVVSHHLPALVNCIRRITKNFPL